MQKAILSILAVFALAACGGEAESEAGKKPAVKIGVSLPLTGNMTYVGVPAIDAAKMALEKWKSRDTKFDYEFVVEDDGYDQKKTAMVGNKLVNLDKVNAIIGIWNITNYQYRELAHRANIPFMSCGWGHGTSDGELVFNNQTPHDEHARAFVEIVRDKLKAKNIAYVGQLSNGDLAIKEDILEALKKAGVHVVFEESAPYGTTDYRMMIQKIKAANPEAIVVVQAPSELAIFTKQVAEAGVKIPLTSVDYFESVADPNQFNGMYMAMSSSGTPEFKKRLAARTGKPWVQSDCVAPVYDNIDILIYAFENAEAAPGEIPSTESVVKVIKGIEHWKGAMMDDMSVRADGRIFSPAYVAVMKDGKAEIVE